MLFLWDASGSREPELSSRLGAGESEDADALAEAIQWATEAWENREAADALVERLAPQWPPHRQPSEASSDTQAEQPARTPPPQISPQLSPGDQASMRHSTGEDVNVAQKNLQQANGKVLNAAQLDLQEKIRSFLAQSEEAGKAGDWSRAQTLAQKARLLSVELVDSL